jgi:hypothetical protein
MRPRCFRMRATLAALDFMSSILKKFVVILFVAFAALSARAWAYDGPGRDWTVRGIGLREWVVVRHTQTVSVRTEFCVSSYHYTVQGPIERWACISIAVLIVFPAILFFGIQTFGVAAVKFPRMQESARRMVRCFIFQATHKPLPPRSGRIRGDWRRPVAHRQICIR